MQVPLLIYSRLCRDHSLSFLVIFERCRYECFSQPGQQSRIRSRNFWEKVRWYHTRLKYLHSRSSRRRRSHLWKIGPRCFASKVSALLMVPWFAKDVSTSIATVRKSCIGLCLFAFVPGWPVRYRGKSTTHILFTKGIALREIVGAFGANLEVGVEVGVNYPGPRPY